jgi:carboxymethylenebutenolidase
MKLTVESHWQTLDVEEPDATLAHMDAFVAFPKEGGPYPGILVFQEIFGVNSHIRDVCARIAAHGYVALAPDIYHRTVQRLELGYDAAAVAEGRKHKDATTREGLLRDAHRALLTLQERKDVQPDRIGCVGFCFGGHVAFIAASLPEIKATACFYGGGIQNSLDLAPQIKGHVRLIYGEDDKGIPPDVVESIALKLQAEKVDFMVTTYTGAQHGFACDQRASYNAQAADDAWREVYGMWQHKL